MPYLTKLKKILQSKCFYYIFFIIICIYVLLTTVFIKYESNIDGNTFEGVITSISVSDTKVSFILKSKEKIQCNFYLKDNDNTDYLAYLGKKVKVEGVRKEISNNLG